MKKQSFRGIVIKMGPDKAVTVLVSSLKRHPRFQKVLRRSRKFMAENIALAKLNEKVLIVKVRPLSKLKHFVVQEVVK